MSSFDRLRQAGVEPAFCLDHGMTTSLYYRDPEGNFVELQCDNFSDWKLLGEFMRNSSQFAANPIGVFFDPARVYETFKSGTDFKTLHRAVYAGDAPELAESLDHDPARVWTSDELLAIAFKHSPVFAPGTKYDYCNTRKPFGCTVVVPLEDRVHRPPHRYARGLNF
jgi:hypothetical protein